MRVDEGMDEKGLAMKRNKEREGGRERGTERERERKERKGNVENQNMCHSEH